jgi:hypothetical protein
MPRGVLAEADLGYGPRMMGLLGRLPLPNAPLHPEGSWNFPIRVSDDLNQNTVQWAARSIIPVIKYTNRCSPHATEFRFEAYLYANQK